MSPIIFNGKFYSSVDEMPPEVRQAYEQFIGMFADRNQDGIPDIVEGAVDKAEINVHSVSIGSDGPQIVIDGKAYASVEEMPAEARQEYEQTMAQFAEILKDANQNQVPDILEGILPDRSAPSALQAPREPVGATLRSTLESALAVVPSRIPKLWLFVLFIVLAAVVLAVIGGLVVLTFFR